MLALVLLAKSSATAEQHVGQFEEPAERFFGVNYNAPFAFTRRAILDAGYTVSEAIDKDIAHFKRLGIRAFRIHLWDREIANRDGSLKENDHLADLDYLLAELADADIHVVLTLIAWWPNGYPGDPTVTESFSDFASREELAANEELWPVLHRYGRELLVRKNSVTGVRYVDDSNIVAIELFNEPKHSLSSYQQTTRFIDEFASALRDVGYDRSIYYNISEQGPDLQHGTAVCQASIDGITYQWYPTGLANGRSLTASLLPNVQTYNDPFASLPECDSKRRVIYEFDAADSMDTRLYPQMAHAFKEAGFEWATMFSYDPTVIAAKNIEYPTHFLNLIYTPEKAIAFMVASRLFTFDDGKTVGGTVSHYRDGELIHVGEITKLPAAANEVRSIAAVGSSPLIEYRGNGAYFLDRLSENFWRLEVLPDVVRLGDPFDERNFGKDVRDVSRFERKISIKIPELGRRFNILSTKSGIESRSDTKGTFDVSPGVYYLGDGEPPSIRHEGLWTPPSKGRVSFELESAIANPADRSTLIKGDYSHGPSTKAVQAYVRRLGHSGYTAFDIPIGADGRIESTLENGALFGHAGELEVILSFQGPQGWTSFPGAVAGRPTDFGFGGTAAYSVTSRFAGQDITIFDMARDQTTMIYPHTWGYGDYEIDNTPVANLDVLGIRIRYKHFPQDSSFVAVRSQLDPWLGLSRFALEQSDVLTFESVATCDGHVSFELALTSEAGRAIGVEVPLTNAWARHEIPLGDLKALPYAILPRAYPIFQQEVVMPGEEVRLPELLRSFGELDGVQIVARNRSGKPVELSTCAFLLGRVVLRK